MSPKGIIVQKENAIAWITLNRPDVMNALDGKSLTQLEEAIKDIGSDALVRVAVIRGVGKAFCVGADLKDFDAMRGDPAKLKEAVLRWGRVAGVMEDCPKPIIASVHGFAFAGGLELCLACDLVIAAEDARIGDQHARIGLVAGGGGTQRLPRLIGIRRAKELLLTGAWISGKEAERIGLVNRCVPADRLYDACREMAQELAKRSPMASATVKALVNRGMQTDLETGLALESWAVFNHNQTRDAAEGMAAFKEKRTPLFEGR